MSCETFIEETTLYVYGELAPEAEETFEQHLETCAECRTEVGRIKAIGHALDGRMLIPQTPLLAECRQDLMRAVERVDAPARRWGGFGLRLPSFMNPVAGLRQLAFAAAFVAVGFLVARAPLRAPLTVRPAPVTEGTPIGGAGPVTPGASYSNVRSVQPDPASGRVRIGLQETQFHFISGTLDEDRIQKLLLAAAADETNPGLRVDSIEILKDHSQTEGVRKLLLQTLAKDSNPGVRLKALEGLKSLPPDPEIREALAQALTTDHNPGVRIQAIEMLTRIPDESLVGVFQNVVSKEGNNYVRLRVRKALRELNASEGTF